MYRPQFVYLGSPANTRDFRCTYSFDFSNVAAFASAIPANNAYSNPIRLPLDQDADFFLRAIQIQETALFIGLLDPFNNQLIDPLVPGNPPTLLPDLWAVVQNSELVVLESDNWGIYCPAGSQFTVYVQNPTAAPIAAPIISLHGIKRYCGEVCK